MCGIVGLYYRDPSRKASPDVIGSMLDAIVHRGPDDAGVFVDSNLGLGMRRLAIVDLAGGHQPMSDASGDVTVVFNGEIYNYPALKRELEAAGQRFRTKSDTEALVHGYREWGLNLPQHLNGMFAFSLWDSHLRRLVIARDHVGIKPLYIYEDDELIAWASEIKALLRVPSIRAELDQEALFDFMTFGYVPTPRTMFQRIRKLEAASLLTIQDGEARQRPFWELAFGSEPRTPEQWSEELRFLIDDAVSQQLMSDVPLGAFLSGGVDSTAIVATMHRLGVERISTYSIGFGAEDAFHNELPKAAAMSRLFQTDHHEILVEPDVADLIQPLMYHLDEPVTDTSFIVTYLVSKLARETVTVILSGVGGDEIFGGYRRYLWPRFDNLYKWIGSPIDRGIVRPLVSRLPVDRGSALKSAMRYARGYLEHADKPSDLRYQGYVGIYTDDESMAVLSPELVQMRRQHTPDNVAQFFRDASSNDPLNQMLYADLKTSLVDSLLAFTDKMSMAVSLEARVPLLDYRIVELAAKIPTELKIKGLRGTKHIFKDAMGDRLPRSITQQKKQGFGTPISRWFRGQLREMLTDLLSPNRISEGGYFNPKAVARLVDDHLHERADYSEHLLALLTFEIWRETFLGDQTR